MPVYKRNAKGEIVKKGDGTWFYDFSLGGKRFKRALRGIATREEAKAIEASVRHSVYAGTYNKEDELGSETVKAIGFSDFVNEVYLPYQKNVAAIRSYESYSYTVKVFCRFFKQKPINEIDHTDVDAYRVHRLTKPKSDGTPRKVNTVNIELLRLSGIFKLAFDRGLIVVNPCARVQRPKVKDQRTRVLLPDEEDQLLSQFKGKNAKLIPIVRLAILTGMRMGEVVDLEWKFIDFTKRMIYVPISLSKTKTPRPVALNDTAFQVVQNLRATTKGKGRVFTDKRINRINVSRTVARIADRCGLPDVTMHTFRHTAITRMVEGGANLMTIREQVGHAALSTTQRYTHISNGELHRAAKILEKPAARSGNVPALTNG